MGALTPSLSGGGAAREVPFGRQAKEASLLAAEQEPLFAVELPPTPPRGGPVRVGRAPTAPDGGGTEGSLVVRRRARDDEDPGTLRHRTRRRAPERPSRTRGRSRYGG